LKKPIIEFKNVSKVFEDNNTVVLKDINFELEEGKFYTLLGASGSGKSTILNIIAGLLDASTGDVFLDGVRINDVPTNKRDVHTVFQSYALFPHMNVFENVAFPLRLRKVEKKEIERRVKEVLKMVQLEGFDRRSIRKLSGGQQQKIQLGVTIMGDPELLILDEPTKGFDPVNRRLLMNIIEERQKAGATVVFVTHQMEEVERLCDKVVLLKDGNAVEYGTVADIRKKYGGKSLDDIFVKIYGGEEKEAVNA